MKKFLQTTTYVLVLSLIFPAVGFSQLQFEKAESRGDFSPVFHTGDESGEWLRWDEGIVTDAIGITSPGWWTSAILFDTDDLADYDGWAVTKILVYQWDLAKDAIIKIWQGPDKYNLTEYVSKELPQQQQAWIEVDLDAPYHIIDASKELIFGIEWDDFGGGYFPAGYWWWVEHWCIWMLLTILLMPQKNLFLELNGMTLAVAVSRQDVGLSYTIRARLIWPY